MINPNEDALSKFADWYLHENCKGVLNRIKPPKEEVICVDGLTPFQLYQQPPFQVELVICQPNVEIPDHTHPNVDSFEVALYGMTLRHCGNTYKEENLQTYDTLRVRPTNIHGGTSSSIGGAFLSIQHWLNGVPIKKVGQDWEGEKLGVQHKVKVEEYENKLNNNKIILADSTDLRDYVQIYQNLLAPSTCEQIIEWAEQQPDADDAWQGWMVAEAAVSNTENKVTDHRTCHFTMMGKDRGVCVDNIEKALNHISKDYPYQHGATAHTGIQIMRYQVGHKFKEHIDHYGGGERILSISILLNHDYKGGELAFWQDKHAFRYLCAGDGVVFPSNLCFPHEVKPVTEGIRYALVVWMQ